MARLWFHEPMELRALSAFVAVVDEGGLSAAARCAGGLEFGLLRERPAGHVFDAFTGSGPAGRGGGGPG